MSRLEKIAYLTKAKYNELATNNLINDNYLYFITDETVSASDLGDNFILPVSKGGTGKTLFTSGSLLVGNGQNALTEISATDLNTPNTIVKRNSSGGFSMGLLKVIANNNTTTIGSLNASWCHIYNSLNWPFIFNNSIAATGGASASFTLGTTSYPFHLLILGGTTNATMTAASTNPRITFLEKTGTQPVHLIYTDQNTYREPAGLKIVGGTEATPAWFEAEGSIFANGGYRVPHTGNITGTVGGATTPVYVNAGSITACTPYPVTSVNSKTGAVTLTAGDLNLASALRFLGISSTTIADGSTSAAKINGTALTATTGDVVLYSDGEYVWTGSAWEYIGGESSYKKVQNAISDPTAGTTAVTTFIATIGQDTQGVITATKRPLPIASTSVTGIVKLGTAAAEAAKGNHTHSTTMTKTGTLQIDLAASTVYTLTAGGTSVVFKTPADTKNTAYGNISTAGAIAISTSSTIATNDALVISTSAGSGKITRSAITFDTTVTDKVLSLKGEWVTNIVPSAYCDIATGTKDKTAVCTDYALTANSWIHIIMKNANTNTAATLSINSQTAKSIKVNGGTPGSKSTCANYLPAGSYLVFYDGTNYQFRNDGKLPGNISGDAMSISGATITHDAPSSSSTTATIPSSTAVWSAITTAINSLDVDSVSGFGAGKTLSALSETDGKISATFLAISITKGLITDFPSSMTPASHTHGNISNTGTLGSTASYGVATDTNKKIVAIDLSVSAPNASGTATTFVTSVTQSSQGKISVARSTVPAATTQVAGIMKLGASGGAATYDHTHSNYLTAHGKSYGGIQVSAQSTATTTLTSSTAATTVTAVGANETVKFVTKNKWVVIKGSNSSTGGSDEVLIAHAAGLTAKTAYGSTSATVSANGGKLTVTDIKYDEAGHITSSTDRTITLSLTTYTLSSLGAAASSHSHGNIANGGTIAVSTSSTIVNGDTIVISTSANSGKLTRASITFDGSTTTLYLNKKGTWTTPPNDKVLQIGSTTDKEYCALFKSTGDDTSSVTASVAFANGSGKLITGNFNTGRFSATSFRVNEQVTLQWNSTDSALEFVFA